MVESCCGVDECWIEVLLLTLCFIFYAGEVEVFVMGVVARFAFMRVYGFGDCYSGL